MAAPAPPMDKAIVKQEIKAMGLPSVGLASIRELNRIVNNIEAASNERFIRMEMGVPGLEPPRIAVDAEIEALKRGVGSKYPPFDGIPELKAGISTFVKNFLGVAVAPEGWHPQIRICRIFPSALSWDAGFARPLSRHLETNYWPLTTHKSNLG